MADHHDDDHDHGNLTFVGSPGRACVGFLVAFLAYFVGCFEYVENQPSELAKQSARGRAVTWTTFDKHFSQAPAAFLMPASGEEVVGILRDARDKNLSVKVVGSGHSWSPLGLTDGVMLSLDRMNRVLSIDAAAMTVTAQAGIRIRDLSAALAAQDPPLALANTGVLDRQSLAGALSTATHGTGVGYGVMSTQVRALELVTSRGEVMRVQRDDPDPFRRDVFSAAVVGLGVLGVITEVTIDAVGAFSVIKRTRLAPLQDTVDHLQALAMQSDHVLAWWIPYTNTMQLLESNRTARGQCPANLASLPLPQRLLSPLLPAVGRMQMRLLSMCGYVSSRFPARFVPLFNRLLVGPVFHALAGGTAFVKEGHKGITLDAHPDQYRETEYFLPPEQFATAFEALRALLDTGKGTLGANFVIQIRMTKGDDLWLSPVSGPEDYYVALAVLVKGFDVTELFRHVEDIMLAHGGRPHWGKLHRLEHAELAVLYGGAFEKFLEVRRALDPTDALLNAHTRALLTPRAYV